MKDDKNLTKDGKNLINILINFNEYFKDENSSMKNFKDVL